MREQIQYGKTTLIFDLEFVNRKTLGIKVHPDNSIYVLAPQNSSLEKVKQKVKNKASWIIRQQDFFLSFQPLTPPRKFISGETHLYLGKQYRLKVHTSNSHTVKLKGGYINVYTREKNDKEVIENQLKYWYKEKAKYHFNKLFEQKKHLASKISEKEPVLNFQWMTKRWGSCNKKGKINLNIELIKAPKSCIEYVIIHEMCHLKHLNHSAKFFKLLDSTYPEWEKAKEKLEICLK